MNGIHGIQSSEFYSEFHTREYELNSLSLVEVIEFGETHCEASFQSFCDKKIIALITGNSIVANYGQQ